MLSLGWWYHGSMIAIRTSIPNGLIVLDVYPAREGEL